MGLYVNIAITHKIGDTSALAQTYSNRSLDYTHATTASFADEMLSIRKEVADSAVDDAVNFGPLTTAHSLLIVTDRQISIKLDGTSTGTTIGTAAATGGEYVLTATSFTSLTISNASGGTANVDIVMTGV